MDDLTTRMHSLPTEIFDLIADMVFETEPATVHVDPKYKPPVQLQICRSIRTSFAERYYTIVTFSYNNRHPPQFVNFLRSLTESHRHLIRKIHVIRSDHAEMRLLEHIDHPNDTAEDVAVQLRGFYGIGARNMISDQAVFTTTVRRTNGLPRIEVIGQCYFADIIVTYGYQRFVFSHR